MALRHLPDQATSQRGGVALSLGSQDLTRSGPPPLRVGGSLSDVWRWEATLGEVHYPVSVGGDLASQVELVAEEFSAGVWKRARARWLRGLEEALAPDVPAFFSQLWRVIELVSDGYLLVSDEAGLPRVEFVSPDEMTAAQGRGVAWARQSSSAARPEPFSGRVIRLLRPSTRYSRDPDAGLSSVASECRELELLKLSLLARISSRLASVGVLFLPNSLSVPMSDATAGTGDSDPLTAFLIDLFESALKDPGKSSAAMPIIIRGPAEAGEQIRHIILDTHLDEVEEAHRRELREVIAQGIGLPVERQTSIADVNHIGAWQVSEDALSNHVLPVCRAGALELTRRVLWPAARAAGRTEAEARSCRFRADGTIASLMTARTDAARQVYDRLGLSARALREHHGFTDADAPDTDETIRLLGVKLNNPLLATWGLHAVIPPEAFAQPSAPGPGGFDADQPVANPENISNPERGLTRRG